MTNKALTGEMLREAKATLNEDQFEAYCEVIGVIFELASIYVDFTKRWRSAMGHYRESHILKIGNGLNDEAKIQSIWDQEFDSLFASIPAQIRMFIKSLSTLRNKTYILVDLIEGLYVAKQRNDNKLWEDDFKKIDKLANRGKELLTLFKSNEAISSLMMRRRDSEHNIDDVFQKQISSLLPRSYKDRDSLVIKYILPDYDRAIKSFEYLQAEFMPVLGEYIK